jgi:hypothetical protein
MPAPLTTPKLKIDRETARRFLLFHHDLLPPRAMRGKPGVKAFLKRVGCIQYDTINVVGRNPDLVLQSRIQGYSPALLESMLYADRSLVDGWDKLASIYLIGDWPYFRRQRERMYIAHQARSSGPVAMEEAVRRRIAEEGPLSSLDFDGQGEDRVDWFWGSTKMARATLEILFAKGELGIHHRVGTRRVFDLSENLLPESILNAGDPNTSIEEYHDWHTSRRIGSLGLAAHRSGEFWLGIHGLRAPQRATSLRRLCEREELIPIAVDGVNTTPLFARAKDWARFGSRDFDPPDAAAFIAPLDNLIWDRRLIAELFGFDYTWEVYKPPASRAYGYYVLPVLYKTRFVARMEGRLDRTQGQLRLLGWWWEPGVAPDSRMIAALRPAFVEFAAYLGCQAINASSTPELSRLGVV